MSDLSSKTACVVDTSGYFVPLARRLGQQNGFGRVLFHSPNWQKGSPSINEAVIGDGFDEIEWCEDFWPIKHEIDLFVFPDLQRAGIQRELRDQGFAVWGAGGAMRLETNRQFFLKKLAELKLDVPTWYEVTGLDALAAFLSDKKDYYLKLSKWRGSWETYHWRSWQEDSLRFNYWKQKFGPMAARLRFLCFPKIDTKLEIGADTYSIDGQWPELMLHGIEKKDSAYLAAVTPRQEMPEELTHILDAFSPYLREQQARTQWSMEVRVTDDKAFFLDGTLRGGLPSTGSQLLALKNLPEIFYYGAMGQMIQPEYQHKFAAECMVRIHGCPNSWETIIVPPELENHLMLADCCKVDGQVWFPADDEPIEEIGWLVSGGNTPTECLEEMNRLSDLLPDGAEAAVESLSDVIKEVAQEEAEGIRFSKEPVPDANIVLEPTV